MQLKLHFRLFTVRLHYYNVQVLNFLNSRNWSVWVSIFPLKYITGGGGTDTSFVTKHQVTPRVSMKWWTLAAPLRFLTQSPLDFMESLWNLAEFDISKRVSDVFVLFLVCQIFAFLTMTSGKIILRRGWYLKTQRIKDSHKLCTPLHDFNFTTAG